MVPVNKFAPRKFKPAALNDLVWVAFAIHADVLIAEPETQLANSTVPDMPAADPINPYKLFVTEDAVELNVVKLTSTEFKVELSGIKGKTNEAQPLVLGELILVIS